MAIPGVLSNELFFRWSGSVADSFDDLPVLSHYRVALTSTCANQPVLVPQYDGSRAAFMGLLLRIG